MIAELAASLLAYGQLLVRGLPMMIAIGAVVPVLTIVSGRCNDQGHWWRNPGIAVDLCYWFMLPLVGSLFRLSFVVAGAFLILGMRDPDELSAMVEGGRGPIAALPRWGQVALYMGATDLLLYWTHRLFHGRTLWRYHAIHHSPADVDWTAAFRFHPVNVALHTVLADAAMILCGMPIEVLVIVAPFNAVTSALVHANLPWTFGPFRYVLASPVFHRWHHTDWRRGGSRNFAPTFPILDVAFGTFFMPKGELPSDYGTDDEFLPESFLAQMLYPFRKPVRGSAFGSGARPAPEAVGLQAD